MKLLLATGNPAKEGKLRWLLQGLDVEPLSPGELGAVPMVAEEESTHLANAEGKALACSRWAGIPAIASDGGLVIPALGERWDALHTRRFAGEQADDQARLDRLLQLMAPYAGAEREAYWIEAVALADRGRLLKSWQVESPRGLLATEYDPAFIDPGFWAFSLWYLPQFGKTHAQLSATELERLDDHWARLRDLVRKLFAPSS